MMYILRISCKSQEATMKKNTKQTKPVQVIPVRLPVPVLLGIFLLLIIPVGCKRGSGDTVTVSILPQKFFVEQIAGGDFSVNVMVGPGQSPATYSPRPSQMLDLEKSMAFFRIGVPFEESWLDAIADANPDMPIIDTRDGITLRTFNAISAHMDDHDEHIMKVIMTMAMTIPVQTRTSG
jgi:ABC-type Zn uptake system ZnuABC Zn-binding protein ZnuA